MGSFANSVFSVMLGWLRDTVNWLWNTVTSQENGGLIQWLGENWLVLVILLCALCMVIDFVVHMLRWQPYKVWASFFRRLFGRKHQEDKPQPTGQQRVIRREWLYADGTARMEEETAPEEVATAPEADWYQPDAAPQPENGEDRSLQYMMQFARPDSSLYQRPELPMQLTYQQEPDKTAPVKGLEDYPQPRQSQQAAPVQQPSGRTDRMHKRVAKLNMQSLLGSNEDELELHYKPVPPAVDKTEAYHAPYYPPQWKRPTDVGASVSREDEGD